MAKDYNVNEIEIIFPTLKKAIQSANLNFLIGSGCSEPAIPTLGNIEKKIQKKRDEGDKNQAEKILFEFLNPFLEVTVKMMQAEEDEEIKQSLINYQTFLENIGQILYKKNDNISPKKANIFSTNYDLFFEKAYECITKTIQLNDGFKRCPSLTKKFGFSSSEYFNTTFNNSALYNYQVRVPSINLFKLHGSLNWKTKDNKIFYSVDHLFELFEEYKVLLEDEKACYKEFNEKLSIVLPLNTKFRDTILNQTYYDMLRMYANELDREQTLLLAEGISFEDQHILGITIRALQNLSLKLIIFCYDKDEVNGFKSKFNLFDNVDILYSENTKIDFAKFNSLISEIALTENG